MLCIIPGNNKEIEIENKTFEYIYPNDLEVIYLLDNNDYLSRVKISANNKNTISKSKDLIEALTKEGKKKDIIASGFKALLPENTKLLNITLDNNILCIDLSK